MFLSHHYVEAFISQTRTAILVAFLLPLAAHAQFRLEQPQPLSPKLVRAGRILDVASGAYLSNQGSRAMGAD
jgi:hypothetical protein